MGICRRSNTPGTRNYGYLYLIEAFVLTIVIFELYCNPAEVKISCPL